MTRYALIAALALLCAAMGWLWVQSGTIGAQGAEIDRLTRSNKAMELIAVKNGIARVIAQGTAARQTKIADQAQRDIEAILTGDFGECINADLPDDLRAILDGVRAED